MCGIVVASCRCVRFVGMCVHGGCGLATMDNGVAWVCLMKAVAMSCQKHCSNDGL